MSKPEVQKITAARVILVSGFGEKIGEFTLIDALTMAKQDSLDLIRIGGTEEKPTCKIGDLSKYLYEQKKKSKKNNNSSSVGKVKEIKFRVTTSLHDLQTFANKTLKMFEEGCKVKVSVNTKGREAAHVHLLFDKFKEFEQIFGDTIDFELKPKLEGRSLVAIIVKK